MVAPSNTNAVPYSNPQAGAVSDSDDSKSLVDEIFHQLSDDEKEQAARASSYRYLVASSSPATEHDKRDHYAKAMIERYITVEQKLEKHKSPDVCVATATLKLRKTLKYRKEKQVDDMLLCFDKEKSGNGDGELQAAIRDGLTNRYSEKASIVRGYTKDGRALFQNFPRKEFHWEKEYYIKGNIYMMERAIACTERNTDGEQDKVVVFYDYNGYGMKNSPPVMMVNELLSDLRDHWPERIDHVFLVDAPLAFRVFWKIIKHFVDPITKQLVQFVTGEEEKKKIFGEMISEDQAAPCMYNGGLNGKEADMKTFFYDTPFDHTYGEEQE
mmetsp:Transcript_23025/g.48554  ORF Transcript_23025/g.48554 Transcript_23025/m.48554 type:complete len:327 (-) Transcript_23025:108-1088(-)